MYRCPVTVLGKGSWPWGHLNPSCPETLGLNPSRPSLKSCDGNSEHGADYVYEIKLPYVTRAMLRGVRESADAHGGPKQDAGCGGWLHQLRNEFRVEHRNGETLGAANIACFLQDPDFDRTVPEPPHFLHLHGGIKRKFVHRVAGYVNFEHEIGRRIDCHIETLFPTHQLGASNVERPVRQTLVLNPRVYRSLTP